MRVTYIKMDSLKEQETNVSNGDHTHLRYM